MPGNSDSSSTPSTPPSQEHQLILKTPKLTNPAISQQDKVYTAPYNSYWGKYSGVVSSASNLKIQWSNVNADYHYVSISILSGEPSPAMREANIKDFEGELEVEGLYYTLSSSKLKEASGKWIKVAIQPMMENGDYGLIGMYYFKVAGEDAKITSGSVSPSSGTINDTKFQFTVKTNTATTKLVVKAFDGYEIPASSLNGLKYTDSGSTRTWTFWLKINNLKSKYINVYGVNSAGTLTSAKKVSFKVTEPVVEKAKISSAKVSPSSGIINDTKFQFTIKTNTATTKLVVKAFDGYEIPASSLNGLKYTDSGSTRTWTFWLKINNLKSKYINVYGVNSAGTLTSAKKVSFKVTEPVVEKAKISSGKVSPSSGTVNVTKFEFTIKTNTATTKLVVKAFDGYEIPSSSLNNLKYSDSGKTRTWTFWLKINNPKSKYINVYGVNSAGTLTKAKKISFKVKEQDKTKPEITKLTCSKGTSFTQTKSTVKITSKASDNEKVVKMICYLDTIPIKESTKGSISASIKGSSLVVGTHHVEIVAFDEAGNKNSKYITFTVKE